MCTLDGVFAVTKPNAATLHEAVAFCRGIEGFMLPAPYLAESHHAVEMLRFAARIEEGRR